MPNDDHLTSAMALVHSGKTMVLATCQGQQPWSAPVYYVFERGGFFFFSSPRSRHIQESRDHAAVAAAIFVDSHRWEEIEGVQMSGRINAIDGKVEQLRVTQRYLKKFPLARDLLSSGAKSVLQLRDKVRIYRFSPMQMHYVNNRMGFGQRVLIELQASDRKES